MTSKPEQFVFDFLPGICPLGETRSFIEIPAPRLARRYQAGHRENFRPTDNLQPFRSGDEAVQTSVERSTFRASGMDPLTAAPSPKSVGAAVKGSPEMVGRSIFKSKGRQKLREDFDEALEDFLHNPHRLNANFFDRAKPFKPAKSGGKTNLRVLPPCASASGFRRGHTSPGIPARPVPKMRAGHQKTA